MNAQLPARDDTDPTAVMAEAFARALGADHKGVVAAVSRLDTHQKQRLYHAASRLLRATRGSMGAAYRP